LIVIIRDGWNECYEIDVVVDSGSSLVQSGVRAKILQFPSY